MFERQTADLLLRSKLPCLGCHQLNGPGGRIGPDLSGLASRRPPTYVYDMIRDPQGTAPGTSMPRVPMSQRWLEVIASFLLQPGAIYPRDAWSRPQACQAEVQRPPKPSRHLPGG